MAAREVGDRASWVLGVRVGRARYFLDSCLDPVRRRGRAVSLSNEVDRSESESEYESSPESFVDRDSESVAEEGV
jgi:hypothetical protein